MRRALLPPLVLLGFTACARVSSAPSETGAWSPKFPFPTDSFRVQQLRPGVFHYFVYSSTGPWAIHILEVNRERCYSALAVKGAPGAVGRAKTSELLAQLAKSKDVVGGVNGDFFLFTPPGVPTNADISGGRVITGPNNQPVLAFDTRGAPSIGTLSVSGEARLPARSNRTLPITAWNRRVINGVVAFDANWGATTDTASNIVEIVLDRSYKVVAVDTLPAASAIPPGGAVLTVGGAALTDARAALFALRPGDAIALSVQVTPHPVEAVGGRPTILRDSAITPEATAGPANGFARLRHPRTAVGLARGGSRLLLVTVDGRQKPYSDGMSLEELAKLYLSLGARDAINLDGGGSTTMVLSDHPDEVYVANKPSDKEGERPVGNALAIVKGCRR